MEKVKRAHKKIRVVSVTYGKECLEEILVMWLRSQPNTVSPYKRLEATQ